MRHLRRVPRRRERRAPAGLRPRGARVPAGGPGRARQRAVPPRSRAGAPARLRPTTPTWPGACPGAGSTTRRSTSTASPSSSSRTPPASPRRCATSRPGAQKGAASLQEAKARARERALPGLDLGPEAQQPLGLVFRGASLREAYLALGRAAGINIIFDPSFQDQLVSLDLKDVGFEQALNALAAAGRTFHRVVDPKILNVVPDTATKRREFEQQVVKTLFLSNADLKETIDLLRVVLGARRVAPLPGDQRPHHQRHPRQGGGGRAHRRDRGQAPGRDRGRGRDPRGLAQQAQGVRDLPHLRPRRPGHRGHRLGDLPRPHASRARATGPTTRTTWWSRRSPEPWFGCWRPTPRPGSWPTRSCGSSEGETAQARFGDQVPVPVTTFTAIATGGIAQQPITSFEYKNVGVNIDITPRVHHDGEVTLQLKLEISAVGAAGFQGLPTFNSRTVNSHHPPARRRDQHAGRAHPRQRAHGASPACPASRASPSSGSSSPATRTRSRRPTS